MTNKTFEVRDTGTCIAVLATRLDPDCELSRRHIAFAGFGTKAEDQATYVILTKLNGGVVANYDPYEWGSRTMTEAHIAIRKEFDSLRCGDVIDVEFIRGESTKPRRSDFA